jgi:peroxiredoxin/N-acetylglutamate synthase-like GNAT family acetyltransferase
MRETRPPTVMEDNSCGHLLGTALPALTLESTSGPADPSELAADLLVLFIYPHATGLPQAPVPGWELIPGARGCTAQSCAFRDQHDRLRDLGATLAGLSVQSVAEQRQFADRVGLRYPLLSDPERRLGAALGLPTFSAGGRTFYERLALIARDRRIVQVFYPVRKAERNASEVVEWLERETPRALSARVGVREAKGDDLPRLEDLLAGAGLSRADLLAAGSTYWLAEHGGEAIGVVGAEWGDGVGLLRSVAVRDEWRRRGCGRRLVTEVLAAARRRGCRAVYLFSTGATEYWPRLGFREVAVDEAVAALPDAPQVAEYRRLGTLCCERAWVHTLE